MKKNFFKYAFLFAALTATPAVSSCSDDDDDVKDEATVAYDVHAVDLGLPSGTKWSDVNYGANTETESGDYYAWGETSPKSTYTEETYNLTISGNIDKTIYDVVYQKEGGKWHIPTGANWGELQNKEYTTWTWETKDGVNGYRVTSLKNGNSIFLPAAGIYQSELKQYNSWGHYHTSAIDPGYSSLSIEVQLKSSFVNSTSTYTYYGQTIRPVRDK